MSDDSSSTHHISTGKNLPWGPLAAVAITVLSFVVAQLIGSIVVVLYPHIRNWNAAQANAWADSIGAQFSYVLLSEVLILLVLWLFLRWRKAGWRLLGFSRWPQWRDLGYAAIGAVGYFALYLVVLGVVGALTDINVQQEQDIGFQHVAGGAALVMTFVSLVVLPPIVEETVFRGFLFGGLRKQLPFVVAAIATSLLFAAPHLLESGDSSLLWVAGVDTFVLSMVLCALREKTGALWASIGVHAIKNGIAFFVIFILHVR
ncbi:MAG TPA: CPBP family intramembrane glutamic endopeptidase [Nevskiaceae bacterium]|nr:CPBP family intramembrane glutamic endopeptidase [Nevskiaceae bacterium]